MNKYIDLQQQTEEIANGVHYGSDVSTGDEKQSFLFLHPLHKSEPVNTIEVAKLSIEIHVGRTFRNVRR